MMDIRDYKYDSHRQAGWPILQLEYISFSLNPIYPSLICSNGKCYIPGADNVDKHIILIKRV